MIYWYEHIKENHYSHQSSKGRKRKSDEGEKVEREINQGIYITYTTRITL
nr:MAG TPA: hypothetical protein [Caudoviricetes sp.]